MSTLKGTAEEIKADLLWVAQESLRTNLVHGTAGNFSARLPDGNVALTPSSLEYDTMTLDDLVVCDLEGNVVTTIEFDDRMMSRLVTERDGCVRHE